jgi:hypothetical protein
MPGERTGGFGSGDGLHDEAQPVIDGPVPQWRSARCGSHGACIEIASLPGQRVAIRDGKSGEATPVLVFTQAEWDAFAAAIKTGELS